MIQKEAYSNPVQHRLERKGRIFRLLKIVAGVAFLILGVLGLLLPVLQGIIFLLIGVTLLADDVPLFARWKHAIYRRWPKSEIVVRRFRRKLRLVSRRRCHSKPVKGEKS